MDPETYTLVKYSVKKMLNLDLDYYKSEQMQRRLDSWLNRVGTPDWNQYFRRLRADEEEFTRFRNYLTINVSTFFRDPERWMTIRKKIVPQLLKDRLRLGTANGGLKTWSAGCSIGVEPYSLAILLDEISPRRHSILASDIDRGALAKAKNRGPFSSEDIQNLSPSQRAAYLEPAGPPFFISERIARRIEFAERNLFTDFYPENLDLLICRNVVIYFTAKAKAQLYRQFCQALRPGGILFIGATEIIPRPHELGLRSYGVSFYQKT